MDTSYNPPGWRFPFLFGGTFIEGGTSGTNTRHKKTFPFLFGGTFIEGPQPLTVSL